MCYIIIIAIVFGLSRQREEYNAYGMQQGDWFAPNLF